ncbi:PorP/SprF family type IX secretion system membrane protein [Pontibacter vulgaris]|uniref:PorP/SprF family type IX secretion system membrane protein n=1 Tax=Pontibacter vulgaris TaxID=2905679 RepID=UPI001FA6AF78|nr:type IX secretion system membrane protein PorP/SprF [Pontibacter vulgaris]
MKRLTAIVLTLVASISGAFAQQRPQYTQYMLNNYLVNPAVGGIESYTDLRTSYRSQWIGVEGAPESFYVTLHSSIGNASTSGSPKARKSNRFGFAGKNSYKKAAPHHGWGGVAQVDRAGLLRSSTLNASYSYHLPVSRYLTLSSGLASGVTNYSISTIEARVPDPNDPYLADNRLNTTKIDLNVGMWLYSPDFFVGLAGTQLLRNQNDFKQGEEPNMTLLPHLYATAGLRFYPSKDVALIPSVMVKATSSASPAIDANLRVMYSQYIWGGASYRHNDAWAVMAGLNLGHLFDVGYSYEVATSEMNQVTAGSHEVVVGFKLNNFRKVVCPQWVW